ncbi:FAD-binding monooxygenase [Fischerella thermalis CCMEE 5201]|jgi:2-polyprenyl-6-methoxyphenol hydroxylase-like FAD-dependent oxidoreductase|nr:FAD-binding monooxygenase [Fischerella thermalis CCMEE 5201]
MNNTTIETDVLIVGGGPVGLGMALELRYQGIDCILVEESDGVITHPKVGTVGPRSMELCRRWGIAQQVRDAGWPYDHPLDIAWVTTVGGHEIFRLHFPSAGERPLPSYTPEPEHPCPHHWLIPLLIRNLGQYPYGSVRLCCRLESFQQTDDGVSAQVTYLDSGNTERIQAKYLVACDGAKSPIRKTCGVDAPAYHPTRVFQNILFQAPELPEFLGARKALVFYMVNPKRLRYPLRSIDGKGLYRLTAVPQEDGEQRDPEKAVIEALGIDTPIEILSSVQWHLTHRVAEHFRHGRIFFVGDSAHTLSPSGGFGMNTGIADAVDLGWKLAATLRGWAGSNLLNTYETERRPIAVRNMEEANVNLQRTLKRNLHPEIMSDSHEGEQARKQMAENMQRGDVRREFDAPGIHFGFRYESPAIIPDDSPLPTNDPHEWTQNSYPGCRAPHAWLEFGKSTIDLFGHNFVLMCFQGQQEVETFEKVCQQKGVAFTSIQIDNPEIANLYERAYVLVRPDGHVAWRGDNLPNDPGAVIDRVRGHF